MSTLAYAALTAKREGDDDGKGVPKYVVALAALVPAEVLMLHATILTFTTKTVTADANPAAVIISEPRTLRWAFFALLAISVTVYVVGRCKSTAKWKWRDLKDWVRALIPPCAFTAWAMLQKTTAFDAVAPDMGHATRNVIALFGGVILGLAAAALAYKADPQS